MRFEGKTAFITGGAVGFGRAFAKTLGAEGACIVLPDVDAAAADQTAKALEADGCPALAVACDVADEATVDTAVAASLERFGGIDVLINNAGLHLMEYNQPFGALSREKPRRLLDVNVVDIVKAALYLLSDDSSFVTGETLKVTGGFPLSM